MILKSYLILSLLTVFLPTDNQKVALSQPNIVSLTTKYPKIGNWFQIPKGTQKITIKVKAENTETVLFWLIPAGTQTWNQRKLIGYDIKNNDKDNRFSLTWVIDQPTLHDHLQIQAIGEGIANDAINLSME